MATIKAPFNFVPLSDKVFFPDWADQISQDIPFEDGVSGTIELKITAQTPIFVRNGHTKQDEENKNEAYSSFSKTPDGKYFIPGTSIKGAIRNVLEIMSFGKMDKNRFQNQSFGIRDLSKSGDGDFYREKIKTENVHCGWLRKSDDEHYYLDDCGLPWRISDEELDRKLGLGIESFVKKADNFKDDLNRTAKKKYEMAEKVNLEYRFISDEHARETLSVGNRLFVKFDSNGESGTIVFTGQPGERKLSDKKTKSGKDSWLGKFFEFVFPSKVLKCDIEVDKYVINDFLSIHKNSPDYKGFRKQQLSQGEEIPIFFLYDGCGKIEAIGLSYMFKYPAYNSIYNAVDEDFLSTNMDLSDCIFGDVSEKSLKGRVTFGHAFSINDVVPLEEQPLTLATPNPSYYPLYLGNGQTWNSPNVSIAGRKRYPVRSNVVKSPNGTDAMANKMIPLPSQTSFTEKIRYHNLRKVEVGALLSAILFHQQVNCYHNIGSGKPLGYGKVKVEVTNMEDVEIQEYLKEFEMLMTKVYTNWLNSSTLKELFAMASGIPSGRENDFVYMHMDTNRSKNEFIKGKEKYSGGEQLGYFSQIINNSVHTAGFIGNVNAAAKRVNIEQLEEQKKQRHQEYLSFIEEAKQAVKNKMFEDARVSLEKAKSRTLDNSEINNIEDEIRNGEFEEQQRKLSEIQRQREEIDAERRKEKKDAGLLFLLEKRADNGKLKLTELANGVKRINDFIKKNVGYQITDNDKDSLHQWLLALEKPTKKSELKDYTDFEGKSWKELRKWLGDNSAKSYHSELNN